MPTKKKQRDAERRAAAEAAKRSLAKAQRRKIIIFTAAAAVAVAVTVLVIVTVGGSPRHATALPAPVAAPGGGVPPWSAPATPDANVVGAGLRLLTQEGTALHFHDHLDILVNNSPVPVPADLGINVKSGRLSEMHTHDTTGVIHIEAPDTTRRYVLGQLFVEWGVRLDTDHIGDLATSNTKTLTAYVNGKPVTGDPAQIELTPHEELTLVYGDATATPHVASSYAFPPGL
jgi:hypothetical protein